METFRRTPLFLCFMLLRVLSVADIFTPNISHYIDCGSKSSIMLSEYNPRSFTPDDSNLLSGKNSVTLSNPNNSSAGSLYSTARASSSNFKYSFNMEPNSSNVLRFHFLPFSVQKYDLSTASFRVQAQNSILLDNFNVSDTISPTIKEFFLWTDTSNLDVEFIPLNSLAFVSAIEAFTAPPGLLSDTQPILIDSTTLNGILEKQVLETMYRVNMPGPLVTPQNDTLWRTWVTDDAYIYNAGIAQINSTSSSLNYVSSEGSTDEIAPQTVYNTARVVSASSDQIISNPGFNYNLTWRFGVSSGSYLIRLHFCDIVSDTNRLDKGLDFRVYIMDSKYPNNVSQHTSFTLEPFYIDFIAYVASAQNISVSIGLDKSSTPIKALLNGLEIMKVNGFSVTANNSSNGKTLPIILGVSIGGVIIIALVVSCLVVSSYKKRRRKSTPDVKETQQMWSQMTGGANFDTSSKSGGATTIGASPRVDLGLLISFAQIKLATNNFDEKNLIGLGGFGKVYKGTLSNGTEVAVKRASSRSQQGLPEFQTEIEVLSQIRHRHLVSLIGYCDERSEMILVYEYMEKGPLRNYLYGQELPPLSWKQRLEICIESAKGLHYLHTGYSQTIIHRDVKSTNILLGQGFLAKVSDFGLSKLGASMGETHVSTAVKGTFGYLDPEYFKTQKLTDRSDVYSFGVTLLEVLCARPVLDNSLPREEINLAEWALMWQRQGQLEKIIDQRIVGEINENSLRKFWETTEKCLKEYGTDRPAIGDVLWNLEYCLQLQEADVRREPYDDSGTSVAHFPAVPVVRRLPSSVVSHETGTADESQSDITQSNVFSQLISREGR